MAGIHQINNTKHNQTLLQSLSIVTFRFADTFIPALEITIIFPCSARNEEGTPEVNPAIKFSVVLPAA